MTKPVIITLHVKRPNKNFKVLFNAFLTAAREHRLGIERVDFGPVQKVLGRDIDG